MLAELRAFGNMDMNSANLHLKQDLKAVKAQAATII